jgi:acetamidase/formamidase
MDKGARPVIQVWPGETLLVKTEDCFSNQIREPLRHLRAVVRLLPRQPRHWSRRRGGRLPGDVLEVRIEEIRLPEKGVVASYPGWGPWRMRWRIP